MVCKLSVQNKVMALLQEKGRSCVVRVYAQGGSILLLLLLVPSKAHERILKLMFVLSLIS